MDPGDIIAASRRFEPRSENTAVNPAKLLSLKNFSLDSPHYLTYDTAASGGVKWIDVT
jgi:hypothetical protein